MRTLTIRFLAAEDGRPVEGSASLLSGRWRTPVDAKQRPARPASVVEFDVDDATVVNEVLATAPRRFYRHEPWPKSDVLEVRLEKTAELLVAVNHDADRLIQIHPSDGQQVNDILRNIDHRFQLLRPGNSFFCPRVLPGRYQIDVFDDAKHPLTQLTVDLLPWRTAFVEVP